MKSKHIQKVLLLVAITILLIGLASAATTNKTTTNKDTKVIKDNNKNIKSTTDTTKKVATKTVTNNKTQKNKKIKEETQEKTTQKIEKNKQKNIKTEQEVSSWNDLQTIIGQANTDTSIKLQNELITTDTITWSKPYTLTIDGNGQTINGNQNQVFRIEQGSTLHLKNITIKNAQTTGINASGGAIYNNGTLNITHSTLQDNTATATATGADADAYAYGGAIYNNGTLTITHSTLQDNTANATATATATGTYADAYAIGGAIYNNGTLTINNSTLQDNTATATATGTYAFAYAEAYGGAIYNNYGGTLTINNSTLQDNTATATATGTDANANAYGGAIYNNYGGTLTINNSTLQDNTATATGETAYANAYGGAIYNNYGGTLNITHSTLQDNTANAITTGTYENANAYGGAIHNEGGTLTITHSTLQDNTATATGERVEIYGGAIHTEGFNNIITDTTFYKNTPENFIINETKNIQILNKDNYISIGKFSIIADGKEIGSGTKVEDLENIIISDEYRNVEIIINGTDDKTLNNRYMLRGFSIDVHNYTELVNAIKQAQSEDYDSYLINLLPGNYNATTSINWEESATKNLIINGNNITLDGKGEHQFIRIGSGLNLTLNNITITNYTVTATGETAYAEGGAIYNQGNLNINNSTLQDNTATATATATGTYAYAEAYGGAIYNNGGTLTITHSTLQDNTANATATATATYANAYAEAYGGAIYNNYGGTLNITHSTLQDNTANSTATATYANAFAIGGAIYNDYGGTLNITHSTLQDNTATATGTYADAYAYGGAIYNNGGTLTITHSTLQDNTATATGERVEIYGGAIHTEGFNNIITDTTFYKNTPENFIINETKNIQILNKDNYISIGKFSIIADGKEIGSGTKVEDLENIIISDEYRNVEIIINGTDDKTLNNRYMLRGFSIDVHNYTELVNAIKQAQSEDYDSYLINLLPGNYNATTSINWEESATKNLIINGNNITLDGKGEHQFIRIGSGLNLTLNNITITNYIATYGGAIDNAGGNLTIINSTFSKNTAKSGGAIRSWGISPLIVKDSVFVDNKAIGDERFSFGGAITGYDIDISNSTFINNTAIITGGAVSGTNVNISISNFIQNTAKIGGAIWIEKTLNVSNSYFKQNNATEGGAIYVQQTFSDEYYCEIVGNHFEDNRATEESIYIENNLRKIIKDNTYKNTTIGYTDFILTIDSSKTEFMSNESLPLKYNASLVHPDWYDEDILDRLSYEINIIDNDKINVTGILANIDLKNYKGKYTANVYNDIFETSNNVEFIVTMPTSINMKVTNNTMGNVIINVDVKDINNEYVTSGVLKVYNDEEEIASIQLKGKSENITLDLDKGEYTLKLEYKANSNDYYLNSTLTDEVTIVSTTSITLTTKNVYIGDSIVFNGTLKDAKGRGLNTNITVTINNKKETVTVTDGKFQIKYTATKEGTVKIIAAFPGDRYNLQSNTTGTFNVQKIDTQLSLVQVKNIYVGDKFILNITLTDTNGNKLSNKTVQVQINKESTTFNTDKNGNIIYTENWKDNGTFKITISFNGDNKYNPSDNVTQTFKVEKIKTTLKVKNQKIQNKDKVKLTATITDQNNKKVNTGKVIFKINGITIKDKNGKAITAKVSKGQATLTFTPNKNYYNKVSNITAVYSENNKYLRSDSNAKLTLKPRDAKIKLQTTKLNVTQYDTITIKTISKDKNKKAIKEGYVIFKINNKTLTKNNKIIKAKIKNGKATLKYNLNGHKTGKYTLTAALSSTPYKKVTSKTTLKITQDKIHIQAKAVKTSTNKTRIKAKILDTKNKYIKTTIKVSLKIDQKTVAKQVKVKNGKINLKIPTKVTKGKHTLNIVAGPNYRYKVTRKNVTLIKT